MSLEVETNPCVQPEPRASTGAFGNRKSQFGQYMTPLPVAKFMASLFEHWPQNVRLLEPGSGLGSLADAFAHQFFKKGSSGAELNATCFEIDDALAVGLDQTLQRLERSAHLAGYKFSSHVHRRDFIGEACPAQALCSSEFTHVILNPPYKKIAADSDHRLSLRKFGIECTNLYAAFLGLATALTADGGEIVAIVPRSFCNGPYFRPFRKWLLGRASLRHVHVFESRSRTFRADDVLQENVIVRLERGTNLGPIRVSTSYDATFSDYIERSVSYDEVVRPNDAEKFIRVPTDVPSTNEKLFAHTLAELGFEVLTGPVVDFRLRDYWLKEPSAESVPLLYAHHFSDGRVIWPRKHKKPNALKVTSETKKWLMPPGFYTLIKRFSAKEERRRVVAYALDPSFLPSGPYGIENHLNVIHCRKQGLEPDVARGLTVFLNSTVVDRHFRSFSGHTQVNATDLRQMRFPDLETLTTFGMLAAGQTLIQSQIDELVDAA